MSSVLNIAVLPDKDRQDIRWGLGSGRASKIRTYDPLTPRQVRYQTAP